MKCRQCGVSFGRSVGFGSFCCKKCANKWYQANRHQPFKIKRKKDHLEECRKIRRELEKAACQSIKGNFIFNRSLKRIFCYVCVKLKGYTTTEAGAAMGVDHTTVIYHLRKVTDEEIEKANLFYETLNSPTPKLEKSKNIYEEKGFRYDNGKKEVSTVWKRVYPLGRKRGVLSWGL